MHRTSVKFCDKPLLEILTDRWKYPQSKCDRQHSFEFCTRPLPSNRSVDDTHNLSLSSICHLAYINGEIYRSNGAGYIQFCEHLLRGLPNLKLDLLRLHLYSSMLKAQ